MKNLWILALLFISAPVFADTYTNIPTYSYYGNISASLPTMEALMADCELKLAGKKSSIQTLGYAIVEEKACFKNTEDNVQAKFSFIVDHSKSFR